MSDTPVPAPAETTPIPLSLTGDWDTLIAHRKQMQAGDLTPTLTATRADLLNRLRLLGADRFESSYDAYGDSGEVESLTAFAEETALTLSEDLSDALDGFVWDMAYSLHPGFENNEGGYGTLEWDMASDKIDLSHSDRYVASAESLHSF